MRVFTHIGRSPIQFAAGSGRHPLPRKMLLAAAVLSRLRREHAGTHATGW
jgi:hypothetical protein